MDKKVTFKDSSGNAVKGILSGPAKKDYVILHCHGFMSSKDSKNNVQLRETLTKAGISVLSIDFFGHGESEGKLENLTVTLAVDDILRAVEWLGKSGFTNIGLLGSSFGGLASLIAASRSDKISFLILKSPVSDLKELYDERLSERQLVEWKLQGFINYEEKDGSRCRLDYSFYDDLRNNNGYEVAAKIAIPTLIVHGDKDEEVPVEQSIKLSGLIPKCRLHIVKGAGHTYTEGINKTEMLQEIVLFSRSCFRLPQ